MNTFNEESFSFIEYISENFFGLTLLVSVIFIIYFVDYINRINLMLYSTPNLIPSFTPVGVSLQSIPKKRFKKR